MKSKNILEEKKLKKRPCGSFEFRAPYSKLQKSTEKTQNIYFLACLAGLVTTLQSNAFNPYLV